MHLTEKCILDAEPALRTIESGFLGPCFHVHGTCDAIVTSVGEFPSMGT